jgi:hypothetical protein
MRLLSLLVFILFCASAFSQEYTRYNQLLKSHVDSRGRVDYKKLATSKKQLDQVLQSWQQINFHQLRPKAQLAFLINVYNLATLKAVVDHYPIASIKDINKGKIWDEKRVKLFDKKYSLNEIENELIRAVHKEARVHFVLNCAAKSCPQLLTEALTEANLEKQLMDRTRKFIRDVSYNSIKKDKIVISSIFDWYQNDFGNIIQFINQYHSPPLPANTIITYAPYDWKLNEQ